MAAMVGRKNWIIILILILSLALQPRAEARCDYTYEVKTGDEHGAGTDARITFRLCSHQYRCAYRTVDSSPHWYSSQDLFERGQLDTFVHHDFESSCVDPCVLVVESNGAGDYPAWYVEWVRVTTHGDISAQHTFYFNTWVGEEGYQNYAAVNDCNSLNRVKATAA